MYDGILLGLPAFDTESGSGRDGFYSQAVLSAGPDGLDLTDDFAYHIRLTSTLIHPISRSK
ncbi:MAG TPA: hypothetical protein VF624_06485 [Tepidisphaeraceae bacterium]